MHHNTPYTKNTGMYDYKISLKITKGLSESVNRRRTDPNENGLKDKQRSTKHYIEN